jgi:cytochrome c553
VCRRWRLARRSPASPTSSPSTSWSSCATAAQARRHGGVGQDLTDDNIRELGAYYESLPPPPPLKTPAKVDEPR